MGLALSAGALALAEGPQPALQPSAHYESFEAAFGARAYSWTVCTFSRRDHTTYSYGHNLLWPNGFEWVKLPKNTHLLLFGKSSMAQIASALRAASEVYGMLEKTVTVSAARDCQDPRMDPRTHFQSSVCNKGCARYMPLGPTGKACNKCNVMESCGGCHDPHAITVDYLAGGSTITTFANHAQSQRLEARLDEYLSMVTPHNGTINFTHGAFMEPHSDSWFDDRCAGTGHEPRALRLHEARKEAAAAAEATAVVLW